MAIVAGLFRERERALRALADLQAAGFERDALMVVASPAGAGEAAFEAAHVLERPEGGFVDLGAALGGQADRDFPDEERITAEERVAQGDLLVRVEIPDRAAADRVEEILRAAGAERVLPGTIRD
jgi:hypothetical protein